MCVLNILSEERRVSGIFVILEIMQACFWDDNDGTNPLSKEMLLYVLAPTSGCLARKRLPPEPEIGLIPGTLFPPPLPTVDIISCYSLDPT